MFKIGDFVGYESPFKDVVYVGYIESVGTQQYASAVSEYKVRFLFPPKKDMEYFFLSTEGHGKIILNPLVSVEEILVIYDIRVKSSSW